MRIVEKSYYVENTEALDVVLFLFMGVDEVLACTREHIEMGYSKITFLCFESYVPYLEDILADLL